MHGWGTNADQTFAMCGNVDVTRESKSLGQDEAHIIKATYYLTFMK